MKLRLVALALIALSATDASAQVSLSGQYRCIQGCKAGAVGPVYVTQNGLDLNLVNEVGEPTRAWVDWPGHIWAQYWNEGAVYSPDGMTIQFDRGTVWQRIVEESIEQPQDTVAYCVQRFKSYDPKSGTYLGYDGVRHSCPRVD